MLLTIGTTLSGSDFGYLLHKHPERAHSFELSFGNAHVFYPRVGDDGSRVALLLDIDPVGLVRGRVGSDQGGALDQYVNDRPYAASSFLSVAISRAFGTAMNGRSQKRQDLADVAHDFEAVIAAAPARSEEFLRELFEPLGYRVSAERHPLDEQFPEWGEGPYFTVRLSGRVKLGELLTHLYVLIPVMDADKHYWVGPDEVEKLLKKGEGWLASHPARDVIAARYLRFDRNLTRDALERLAGEEDPDPDAADEAHAREEQAVEKPLKLWTQRLEAVHNALRETGARKVLDLGCGEGKLIATLIKDRQFEKIVGLDVSWRSLEIAGRKLHLNQMAPAARERIELLHGSLMYGDKRTEGFDAAAVVEVIEHLDAPRLSAFEKVVFERARPKAVVITTPNAEYNKLFEGLPAGQFRHKDHRFEWTRAQFAAWAERVAGEHGYRVRFAPIGPEDADAGAPTQMGVFER